MTSGTISKKYKVGICATNPKDTYSGGRYFSLVMAEALAMVGHEVSYITNLTPIFYNEFSYLNTHKSIINIITKDFLDDIPKDLDFVYIFPGTQMENFYNNTIESSIKSGAHIVLINFESPNWFNSLSPERKDESQWLGWKQIASAS